MVTSHAGSPITGEFANRHGFFPRFDYPWGMAAQRKRAIINKPQKRRYRVGIRLLDWSQGFCFRLFPGILEAARSGHELDLIFEQPSGGDIAPIRIDEHWQGDGLLVYRYTATEARAWAKKGIKVVNLSAEFPASGPRFPQVTLDNEQAGAMVANHLMRLGLQRFAYLHDPYRKYSKERLNGYSAELKREGFVPQVIEIPSSNYADGERAQRNQALARKLLAKLEPPTGLFVKDDIAAVCAIRALEALGLRCPEDVPVVGIADDVVYCNITRPALSSVRFPGRVIGHRAMQLLITMMNHQKVAENTRIKIPASQLIIRESSGLVELPDEVVTKAMRYIRDQARKRSVTVEELCRAVGVSRELLRQRFHSALGRTPKMEIDQQRVEVICECLRQTSWKIERIAEATGFGAADELCRFFKRTTHQTVGDYRKEIVSGMNRWV